MASTDRQVYSGRYELRSKLARGGMADVFLSTDLLLDRPVALKVLFPEFASDPAFVQRFRREAQAAARLNHPNVVSVFDWGQEGTTYFIVMEYVEGSSLAEVLRSEGRVPADRAASIAADVADALAFAHRGGVVHRDVKPGNVMVGPSGHVKVADFGIARAVSTAENLTQVGTVMGTATYFSPEQARGEDVDPRSDVYSLGVVLYEMLTGSPPFTGDNPVAVAYKQVQERPVPPRERLAAIPVALEAIVLKALNKNPANRYQSAEDMRNDLLAFRAGRPVVAEPLLAFDAGLTTAVPAAAGATTALPMEPRTEAVRRVAPVPPPPDDRKGPGRGWLVLALLALLAAIVGGGYLLADSLGLIGGTDRVVVADVIGATEEEATAQLEADGFEVAVERGANETVEEGRVFAQNPEPGLRFEEGGTVTLSVSSGPAAISVPSVVGLPVDEAIETLFRAGLAGEEVSREESDTADAGTVISQSPGADASAERSDRVELVVSDGPAPRPVPLVVSQTEGEAFSDLREAGFTPRVLREPNSAAAGTVVDQTPEAGTSQPPGTTVTIVVSSGAPTTLPPDTTTTVPDTTTTTEDSSDTTGPDGPPTSDP
ncbi:Stk1 family PASTA domain-containing Ser/Thr kinase [soil metagenome]